MNLEERITKLVKDPEGQHIEYKPILPPSVQLAQTIAALANAGGGYLILGASRSASGAKLYGISQDFHVLPITHKAIDQLSEQPLLDYGYVKVDKKQLFAISVGKADNTITVEGKTFLFKEGQVTEVGRRAFHFNQDGYPRIQQVNAQLQVLLKETTISKSSLFDHYQGLLRILDNLQAGLYPGLVDGAIPSAEEKILNRLLYSSMVDNFEVFLADLLYEICLAKPETMKSRQTLTTEEILNCADREDLIRYIAGKKIAKLQKGSMRDFIEENAPIASLQIFIPPVQQKVDYILQVRHLYTHRNGIVDEKFLAMVPGGVSIGSELHLSVTEMLDTLEYLAAIADQLDRAARKKYQLG